MTLAELLGASERGAASVYHAVLASGAEIRTWGLTPRTASLIAVGVAVANDMLQRTGANGAVVTSDVMAALKALAAADPSVPSIAGLAADVARAEANIAQVEQAVWPIAGRCSPDPPAPAIPAHPHGSRSG